MTARTEEGKARLAASNRAYAAAIKRFTELHKEEWDLIRGDAREAEGLPREWVKQAPKETQTAEQLQARIDALQARLAKLNGTA